MLGEVYRFRYASGLRGFCWYFACKNFQAAHQLVTGLECSGIRGKGVLHFGLRIFV